MKQSVIISTFNQPKWLAKFVHGDLLQTYRDFEVAIADNGSGERVKAVLASKSTWFPNGTLKRPWS